MKIAWRYQSLPQSFSTLGTTATSLSKQSTAPYCAQFDITKNIELEKYDGYTQTLKLVDLKSLIKDIETHLTTGGFMYGFLWSC
jgi:hypothetical protein